jgi:preprotein translocase subunit SecA
MAGRGTDIVLGGSIDKELEAIRVDETLSDADKHTHSAAIKAAWQPLHDTVLAAGGLHIIGTERHESRRVDNQLRGRSGRQGDAGSSRFYLSLADPLLRIFASDRVASIMDRLKMPEGEAIEHIWVTRAIENAQRKVEARNFDMRKQLLEYDDVSNDQRRVIYQQRNELLEAEDISETIHAMRGDVLSSVVGEYIVPGSMAEQWDVAGLERTLAGEFQLDLPVQQWLEQDNKLDEDGLRERVVSAANEAYQLRVEQAGAPVIRHFERAVMLQNVDTHWREHLAALDHLRQGIHLRGYAQKNPKQEYKREAFELFSALLNTIKRDVTQTTCVVQVRSEADVEAVEPEAALSNVEYHHADYDEALAGNPDEPAAAHTPIRAEEKTGRNDPCWCGSGKKFKHCHGKLN